MKYPAAFGLVALLLGIVIVAPTPRAAEGIADSTDTPKLTVTDLGGYFPSVARARCIRGRSLVAYRISPNGSVADAHILTAEPKDVFEKGLLSSMQKWRADVPATWNEVASRRVFTISVGWDLAPCRKTFPHFPADSVIEVCASPIPGACKLQAVT